MCIYDNYINEKVMNLRIFFLKENELFFIWSEREIVEGIWYVSGKLGK